MIFQAIKERGHGGFGKVEEVLGSDGFRYARKTLVVPPQLSAEEVKPRFEREVKYQGAISHPNVVSILFHDLSADPPWFVMPLAECSLADEMAIDRHLNGDPRNALFHILAGLEEIHRRGFCHRDLKPGNVLKFSTPEGVEWYALSDFGLMAVGEDASSTLTPSGVGGGTPLYQAPECAINFKRATPRSDIYSFGALLHDIFSTNPKRLPHEELAVPGNLAPIVSKCTKRNAHRRYKNVEELREELFQARSTFTFTFQSGEEEQAVAILSAEAMPTADQWDQIFDFLDTHSTEGMPARNVFRALRREHIEHLGTDDPDLMAALGKLFSDHCRELSFDFDYCDVLAAKAQLFYDLGEVGLKADIAVAMLMLGLNHNRWFVERKFVQMVGPTSSDALIQRILVELSVLNIDFKWRFTQLESSISVNKLQLHHALQAILT